MRNNFTFFAISGVFGVLVGIAFWVASIRFDQNCLGHLKRAADANTIEMAISELDIAITYLETVGDTTGYTSVLYNTPDEDIAFWYHNLVASRNELQMLPSDASPMERTNTLMKLRETLTDDGEKGTVVTRPAGIARYPYNLIYGIFGLSALILFCFACVLL